MANLSKVGTKNILGGFVGNKRILEEFIYLDGMEESINTLKIPFTVVWQPEGDPTDYDPSTFGYSLSSGFTIKTINSSTRTITFDYYYNTMKNGYPVFEWVSSLFYTGNLTKRGKVEAVVYSDQDGNIYHTFSYSVYNASATYTQAGWNNFYISTPKLLKKQIYTMIPYSWKSTTTTTPDFNYTTLNELNSNKPACKVFENKVAKIDNRIFMWSEIPEEGFYMHINEEGYTEIRISADDGIPDASYLPPARDYEGTHTVAVVYNMFDAYPPKFFVFGEPGGISYYKCLPD